METWKKDVEAVIKKWQSKGPPAHILEGGRAREQPGFSHNAHISYERADRKNKRSARSLRQERAKEREFWEACEANAVQRKFKLIAPVIKAPRPPYKVYQCEKCQVIQKDQIKLKNSGNASNLFNVIEISSFFRRKSFATLFVPDVDFIISRTSFLYPEMLLKAHDFKQIRAEVARRIRDKSTQNDESPQSLQSNIDSYIRSAFTQITAATSNTFVRIFSWVLLKFFRRTNVNICCQSEDFHMLKEATKKDIPIIYLPLHKTFLDYIIINLTLYCNSLKIPFTAFPDRLCTSRILRFLLRKFGIFFVKENDQSNDTKVQVKEVLLEKYIEQLLSANQSLHISIGDQNLAGGKNQQICNKLLSVVTNMVAEGAIDDVFVVPVNVCYEKIEESNQVTVWGAVKSAWEMLRSTLNGRIHIRVGKPTSLHDFFTREAKFPSRIDECDSSELDLHSSVSTMEVVDSLIDHAVYDCSRFDVLSCTSMVCFLLLVKHKSHATMDDLVDTFDWLKEEANNLNRCFGFCGSTQAVVNYALKILKDQGLLKVETDSSGSSPKIVIAVTKTPENLRCLVSYSHQITSLFAFKAIVASSIIGLIGGTHLMNIGQVEQDSLSKVEMLSQVKFLCSLLCTQYPLYPPCTDIETLFSTVIDTFVASDFLLISKDITSNQPKKRLEDWELYDDEENDYWTAEEADIRYEINLSLEAKESLLFLHSTIASSLETCWFVAASLVDGVIAQKMSDKDVASSLYKNGAERIRKGLSFHAESVSPNQLYHVLKAVINNGVLEEYYDENGDRFLRLGAEYKEKEQLREFIHKIDICR